MQVFQNQILNLKAQILFLATSTFTGFPWSDSSLHSFRENVCQIPKQKWFVSFLSIKMLFREESSQRVSHQCTLLTAHMCTCHATLSHAILKGRVLKGQNGMNWNVFYCFVKDTSVELKWYPMRFFLPCVLARTWVTRAGCHHHLVTAVAWPPSISKCKYFLHVILKTPFNFTGSLKDSWAHQACADHTQGHLRTVDRE